MATEQTQAVLDHHMAALESGDLDEILKDYTEDSVFVTNVGGVVKGLDALRGVFKMAAAGMAGLEVTARHVEGEIAYVAWTAGAIPFGTDTLVVHDGTIVAQTVALHFG